MKVCLSGKIYPEPKFGGSEWLYLTWALGLRELGHEVIWLQQLPQIQRDDEFWDCLSRLKEHLEPYGLSSSLALVGLDGRPLLWDSSGKYLTLDQATEVDLFLDLRYILNSNVVSRFRRSVFIDTDPGMMQVWIDSGYLKIPEHDLYFTISETVGTRDAFVPDCGIQWHYTPPPVLLSAWTQTPAPASAPYTTVTSWWDPRDYLQVDGVWMSNEKRTEFIKYLDLPKHTGRRLELAVTLGSSEEDEAERLLLEQNGWRVRCLWNRSDWTSQAYREYVLSSRGEFSCAKPFYVRLGAALVFDRTLNYLASGKPAIVQHTGPSRFLPDAEGIFRFRTPQEAASALEAAEADYDRHSRLARSLAEEYFDSRKVISRVLEKSL